MNHAVDRRQVVLGGTLLGAAALSAIALPYRRARARVAVSLDALIPRRFAGWEAQAAEELVLPQRDAVTDRYYDDFIARAYHRAGEAPVTMLVAYGAAQTGALQLHRPENCYPPYGFVLGRPGIAAIPAPGGAAITATTLSAWREAETQQLLFWTRIGLAFPASQWATRLAVMRAAIGGATPDGSLVRLSVPSRDAGEATQLMQRFAVALLTACPAPARRLLTGRA